MAYVPVDSVRGLTAFTNTDTSANRVIPVGTIVRGVDLLSAGAAGTGGEFIYLPGVASNAIGMLVTYDPLGNTVTLAPNTANLSKPVAVSMAANTATTSYNWYQLTGVAKILKTAVKVSPAVKVFISGTAGRVKAVASAGLQVLGAITVNAATVASATSTINVLISRPFAQGQIT